MFLKELAEQTGGRYHCYVSTSDVSAQVHKEDMFFSTKAGYWYFAFDNHI